MVEAPERIWATGSFDRGQYAGGSWNATSLTNKRTDYGEVEYVRADLYKQAVKRAEAAERLAGAQVKAINDYLQNSLGGLHGSDYIRTLAEGIVALVEPAGEAEPGEHQEILDAIEACNTGEEQ